MKSTILALFLGMMLTVSMPALAQTSGKDSIQLTQTETPAQVALDVPTPPAKVGFFENIWNKAKDGTLWLIVVPFICGILSKNGITKVIKSIAGKGTIVTKELADVALASNQFFKLLDSAIKDDGTVVQNSLQEAAAAGKTVIAETKDAWVTINPKPVAVIPAV